ncbi:hypothetical protein [Methylotetracoccus oryzae]|uniref:hypothetical protein n=1 Tax=Methylotetracoccus oryzae TaxID=1919059 RepID=UPI0013A5AA1A|nr:hypothetical protein [Methylotetracoccus oryzae]
MKYFNAAAWLAVFLCLATYVSEKRQPVSADDCQVYDRLGRGIGCEDEDLTDRLNSSERRDSSH